MHQRQTPEAHVCLPARLPRRLCCRYAFFAPIWRVMRDDNMMVDEVQRQVEAVALAVKQGSSVSDMRHHTVTGKLKGAQVREAYRQEGLHGRLLQQSTAQLLGLPFLCN